jgi:hypothetical protein
MTSSFCSSPSRILLALALLMTGGAVFASAQVTSTWSAGSGAWSPCPNQQGTALWDTCNANPPAYPNGNYNAVILGGTVEATGAQIVNLSIGTGAVLNISGSEYVDIAGPSVVNNGSIILTSGNGFQFEGNITSTVSGSGSIQMNNSAVRFWGGNGTPTVILQEPLTGQGSILGMALNNQSTITASGGNLSIQPAGSGLTNTGTIQAQSGTTLDLIGAAPFTNIGGTITALNGSSILLQANITGGTITTAGTGNYTLAPPGAGAGLINLTNAGTFNVTSGSGLNWTGTITTPNGAVTLSGSGTVLMNAGGFNGLNTGSLINRQTIHGSGSFYAMALTNQATVNADNTSAMLSLTGGSTINTNTLEARGGGTLELAEPVNNTGGTIHALNGSTVILSTGFSGSGGTLTTSGTGIIESQNGTLDGTVNIPTNTGAISVNGYDLFTEGTIANNGVISINSGCMIMNKPTILSGTGTLTMSTTGCIFGAGVAFTNSSTIEGAGTIGDSNPMPITNSGTIFANQAGTTLYVVPNATGFTNTGALVVNPGSTLSINGPFNSLKKGVLTGGTYTVGGVLDVQNPIVTLGAPLTLGAGAQVFDTFHGLNALASLATNSGKGLLTLQTGQSLTTAGNFTNKAKLIVGAGSNFTAGGSFTQAAGTTKVDGTLTAPTAFTLTKGTLEGAGTIASSVTSNAVVVAGDATTKPGKLTITGGYTQNATGTLDVDITGATVGTQYSQLAVSNGASLNGKLIIKRKASFVPAIGSTFTILTASAISGQFVTITGVAINAAEHFAVDYSSNAVTLAVVAGP